MGKIGRKIGGILGTAGGTYATGGPLGGAVGNIVGQEVGERFIPFHTGGAVKRNTKAKLLKGEYVLPKNAKPTATQRKIVAENKRKAKAKGKKGKK
mgnify:CR=1 FL=1